MPNQMAALVLAAEKLAVSALDTSVGGSTQAQDCLGSAAWNSGLNHIEQQAAMGKPGMWQQQCMTWGQTTKAS